MAKEVDKIIVIDCEATCWQGNPPPGEQQEIIEVGIVVLDTKTLTLSGKRSLLIRTEYSKVSLFCTELTTLTQKDIDSGHSFSEVCAILKSQYRSYNRLFASYGDFDRNAFDRDCRNKRVNYPFGPTHLNVKNLLALTLGLDREVGMDRGLELLGLPLEGTHHRGHDDAYNIGKILANILSRTRR